MRSASETIIPSGPRTPDISRPPRALVLADTADHLVHGCLQVMDLEAHVGAAHHHAGVLPGPGPRHPLRAAALALHVIHDVCLYPAEGASRCGRGQGSSPRASWRAASVAGWSPSSSTVSATWSAPACRYSLTRAVIASMVPQ